MTVPTEHCLILAGILFSTGLLGLLMRRNLLLILLSIELMLNAANLTFVAGSALHGNMTGQMTAFFVMVVAGAEVTIGLAIALLLFKHRDTVDTDKIKWLRG
jgi:NADH-quinone oxidoreductase subunit K